MLDIYFGIDFVTANRQILQIPECTIPISHNAPLCSRNVHMCTLFCYKMVHHRIHRMHCGICEVNLFLALIVNMLTEMIVGGQELSTVYVTRQLQYFLWLQPTQVLMFCDLHTSVSPTAKSGWLCYQLNAPPLSRTIDLQPIAAGLPSPLDHNNCSSEPSLKHMRSSYGTLATRTAKRLPRNMITVKISNQNKVISPYYYWTLHGKVIINQWNQVLVLIHAIWWQYNGVM